MGKVLYVPNLNVNTNIKRNRCFRYIRFKKRK